MEMLKILDTLEEIIEGSRTLPLSTKIVVDGEEILEILSELKHKMPDDLRNARLLNDEREKIIKDAQKEANEIIQKAEDKISTLVDEHEISKKAYEQANKLIENAQKNAREIRLGTREYADDILSKVENILNDTLDVIKMNRQELKEE